jgi:hypothetical protein
MIGAMFAADEAQYTMQADPRDQYDVLMFVENATASRGNKRPDMGTRSVGAANNEAPTNLALAADGAIPTGWLARHHSLYPFRMAAADDASPAGGRTMRIARSDSPLAWGDGEVTQTFPAAPWRGRRLAFGAAMRAEAPRIGTGAQIVVKVWSKGKEGVTPKPLATIRSDGMMRSADWERRLIEVDVPAEAERIQISLVVTGDSAGSFGDLEVAAAGEMPKVSLRPSSVRSGVSERPASIRPAPFRGLGDRPERAL